MGLNWFHERRYGDPILPQQRHEQPWYDVMQVCMNGHRITARARRQPEDMQKRCATCGAETTTTCPSCKADIQGQKFFPSMGSYCGEADPADYCKQCGQALPWAGKVTREADSRDSAITRIRRLLQRFPTVARQLQQRRQGRSTISIDDEYDVQDLLHALLRIEFDDIRAEEWVPSYAGGSSRMDFLLKAEKVAIEAKKTRVGLGAKELGEQLIVDCTKYKQHPDCKTLVCFVYDPELKVGNPLGLVADLERQTSAELTVCVEIVPK